MVVRYCFLFLFLSAFYFGTHKSASELRPYTKYDIKKLCESYSGAFGLHSGTTIDLGKQDCIFQLGLNSLVKIIRV